MRRQRHGAAPSVLAVHAPHAAQLLRWPSRHAALAQRQERRSAAVADNPPTPAESDTTEPTQSDTALAQHGHPDAARPAQPEQGADAPPLITAVSQATRNP